MTVGLQAIRKGTVLRCNRLDGYNGLWVVVSSNLVCENSDTIQIVQMKLRENIPSRAFSIVSTWLNGTPYFVVLDQMYSVAKSFVINTQEWEYVSDMFYNSMYYIDKELWRLFGLAGDVGFFETQYKKPIQENACTVKKAEVAEDGKGIKFDGSDSLEIGSEKIQKKSKTKKTKDKKPVKLQVTITGKEVQETYKSCTVPVWTRKLKRVEKDSEYRFNKIKDRVHLKNVRRVEDHSKDNPWSIEESLSLILDLTILDEDTLRRKYGLDDLEKISTARWHCIDRLNSDGVVWKVWIVSFLHYYKKHGKKTLYSDYLIGSVEEALDVSYGNKKRLCASKELIYKIG